MDKRIMELSMEDVHINSILHQEMPEEEMMIQMILTLAQVKKSLTEGILELQMNGPAPIILKNHRIIPSHTDNLHEQTEVIDRGES